MENRLWEQLEHQQMSDEERSTIFWTQIKTKRTI
jgi:hypothetical protein